jgi:hypothetical protein
MNMVITIKNDVIFFLEGFWQVLWAADAESSSLKFHPSLRGFFLKLLL